ncbi:MAG: UDP-N-acetylmuramoyl-L-alanyl-D-glutamate--2,6-diaminopimelate ligase [Candidatus Daviesbacteria bacterium]|nr:UDP-N-acetylmuramoyl-L-alanyl-D-glutamate--2,6-diaminopimelate ligase [Candidatus Daviesbacteria bacterium]
MTSLIKSFLPQQFINIFYHLPKAILANFSYGFPTRSLKVIGVTGTDGKTTTTNLIYQILKDAGYKVSMVSTINAEIAGKSYDTGFHVTSPEPEDVQKYAKMAKDNGDEYLVLEVTSHALDQFRFWGVKFDIGVITNITHDHLDYHGSFENYFQTKAKLIKNVKLAVINHDEKHFNKLHQKTNGQVLSFGFSKNADFNPKTFPLNLNIPGDYNLQNAWAAVAVGTSLDIEKEKIKKSLENFKSLKGRMDEIKNNRGIKIIVDFAHTPNALEQALKTLRKQTAGHLIAVFGCAGKRDVTKRSLMGKISTEFADLVVITSEDPRGELDRINEQIITGIDQSKHKKDRQYFIIGDREKAVDFAINNLAKKGDTVGIFGKGHEESLNLDGKKEIPWSDFTAVKQALQNGR